MVKQFVKSHWFYGGIMFFPLAIFALLFFLFDLDWAIYRVGLLLSIIFLAICLVYQGLHFNKQQQLAQQVAELQSQLKNERTAARKWNQEMEEYFLLWVHQIKSPISASDLLLKELPREKETVQLQQELVKIENYTNMVLNFLKVSHPVADMDFTFVSLADLLQPLLRKYRLQFIQHKITLHYEPTAVQILTEPNLTSLMIEQILSNALKYAKGKEIWIWYDEQMKKLFIKDSGMGIRSEDIPRIFEKGYAGLNGQLNTKSSGIGLFLVQKIADRLQQTVVVNSTFNKGSEFSIQLFEE